LSRLKFRHSDLPPHTTTFDYIKKQINWGEAVAQVGGIRFAPNLTVPDLEVDAESMLREVYQLYRRVGAIAWRSQSTFGLYGISLCYNPSHDRADWHQASFGHPRYQAHSGFDYFKVVESDQKNRIKDDYLDSLGFRRTLPEVEACPQLDRLLACFQLPLVRSTIRTLNGSVIHPTPLGDGGYHVDDSPFEVLRVNIQLSGFEDYGIQYQSNDPIFRPAMQALVVNTDVPHRVYVRQPNDCLRTNLVLGVTPWLDYDASEDSWSPNEYFGRMHPYDMVRDGLIFKRTS